MRIFGLDFTSAPGKRKPITCIDCTLNGTILRVQDHLAIPTFAAFEAFLQTPGPWLAAFDFPFGQPHKLITNLHWPETWADYIQLVAAMDKTTFEATLTTYRQSRPMGDKQHLRATDKLAGACSPMMLYRVPVGKMFFQGVPRLLAAGVSVLPCHPTRDSRIVVEGYPSLVARTWLGRRSYKSDERGKQTPAQEDARRALLSAVCSQELMELYGCTLSLPDAMATTLVQEPMGDALDALLCALQAAWSYSQRDNGYGIPAWSDKNEGWIVDPGMVRDKAGAATTITPTRS
jgi:Protein of unknown function (DUF429)